jgi:hypothetical protein
MSPDSEVEFGVIRQALIDKIIYRYPVQIGQSAEVANDTFAIPTTDSNRTYRVKSCREPALGVSPFN